MDNLFITSDGNQLNKLFENAGDKLVVVLLYTKNNPECRRAKTSIEKSAGSHNLTLFCIVDIDKFDGESRFVKNINNLPKIDFYYQSNVLGSCSFSNEKEIETYIRSCEQYIITQNNIKNNSTQNNMAMPLGGMVNKDINPLQIQQQILNNAIIQNPTLASNLVQNPALLQSLVQRQMQYMQQQQMIQPQIMAQQLPMNTIPQIPLPTVPQQTLPVTPNPNSSILPTFEQMQQMFKIFQMMQDMGILNTNNKQIVTDKQSIPEKHNITNNGLDEKNIIELPNGDKIIPLSNGKFGLIKKN